MATSFGATNTFIHSTTHITTNNLKYGKKWDYAQKMFPDDSWITRRERRAPQNWPSAFDFKSINDPHFQDLYQSAKQFQEALFHIAQRQDLTHNSPSFLSITDKDVIKLNTYTKGGKTVIGKNYDGLQSVFAKLIGTIDYNNRDSRLYKILNLKIPASRSLSITNTYFRPFDSSWNAKAWFKEILSIFQEYEDRVPAQLDSIDRQLKDTLIIPSGSDQGKSIFHGAKFTNGAKFSKADIQLQEKIFDSLLNLLGRYTVSKMLTGSVFFSEGILSFFAPTQRSLAKATKDWKISLPYLEFPSRGRTGLEVQGLSDYFLETYSRFHLDSLYAPIKFELPVEADVSNQLALTTIPQIPQKLINPYYKSAGNSHSQSLFSYYGSWSLNNQLDFITRGLPKEMIGMSLLVEDLIYLYKEQIDLNYDSLIRQGLTDSQITLYKRIGAEALFSHLFSKDDQGIRSKLIQYFSMRGYATIDIELRSMSFKLAPDIFKKLQLTPDMRSIFAKEFDEISNSLSVTINPTMQIPPVLSANREFISQISDFFVYIANTHGKVRIYGFKIGKNGYQRGGTTYHPDIGAIDPNMPTTDQRYYELDPAHLDTFDLHLFLGGLLADHQTFIIRKEGMEKNEVLFAFSLLDTSLPLDTITSSTDNTPRPGFNSLGGLFTSDQLAFQQLSSSWFNIQSLLWMGKTMNGLGGKPSDIRAWRTYCQTGGIPTHLT